MSYKTILITLFLWSIALKPLAQDTLLFEHLPVLNGRVNYNGTIHPGTYPLEEARKRITRWYHDQYKKTVNDNDTLTIIDNAGSVIIHGYFTAKWKIPLFSKYTDVANNTKVRVFHQVNLQFLNNECFYKITDFRLYVYKTKNVLRPFSAYLDLPIERLTDKTSEQKAEKFGNEVDKKVKNLITSLKDFLK